MAAEQLFKIPWREPGVVYYLVVSLSSLAVVFLVLEERGMEGWGLVPALVGLLGVVSRRGGAPLLLLLALGVCLSLEGTRWMLFTRGTLVRVPDFLLSAAVLAYLAACYRLQGLLSGIVPAEPALDRKGPKSADEIPAPRRSAELVSPPEVGRLLLTLPLWAALAQVCWNVLPTQWGNPGLRPSLWRVMLWSWMIGGLVLAAATALAAWRWYRLSPAEANLYLQDVVWQETRGEQRRLNRWRQWARRRQARREEWAARGGLWGFLRRPARGPVPYVLALLGLVAVALLVYGLRLRFAF